MSMFSNLFSSEKKESLDKGLEKTKESFFGKLGKALVGKSTVDDEVLDNLEEILISSDVGVGTTLKIIQRIEQRVARDKYLGTSELNRILKKRLPDCFQKIMPLTSQTLKFPQTKNHTSLWLLVLMVWAKPLL